MKKSRKHNSGKGREDFTSRMEPLEGRLLLSTGGFLQGVAFVDSNLNNVFDAGESVKVGAVIQLYNSNGSTLLGTTTTNANGAYLFNNLAPGTYQLEEVAPAGFQRQGVQILSQLNPATAINGGLGIQVTVVDPSTVTLTYDNNAFFARNKWENLSMVVLGTPVDAGVGQIPILMTSVPPPGQSTFLTLCADPLNNLGGGVNIFTALPGVIPPVPANPAVAGRVGYLYNHYGQTDLSREDGVGLQLATWELLFDTDGNLQTGDFRVTGFIGPTTAAQLAASIAKGNFYLADSAGKSEPVTFLNASQVIQIGNQDMLATGSLNFGNKFESGQLAAIGDFVWNDLNEDGIQDAGEPGIPGVTVNLFNCDTDTLVGTMLTNGSGLYLFSGLTPGNYHVQFVLPNGYTFSPQDQGVNDAKDSDADVITGDAICTNLVAGETDLTWDAGMFLLQPEINIVKLTNGTDNDSPTGPVVPIGSTVTWTYIVTNPGNEPDANVVVTDDNGTPGNLADDFHPTPNLSGGFNVGDINQDNLLDPGEIWTYTASTIAVAGQYENFSTVTGEGNKSHIPVNDDNPDHYFAESNPDIDLVKKASVHCLVPGQSVTYTYTVTNPGSVPLSNVVLTDDNGTPSNPLDDFNPTFVGGDVSNVGFLDPGEVWTYTATLIPPIEMCAVINGQQVQVGTLYLSMVPDSPSDADNLSEIKAVYVQSLDLNDNSYGANIVNWPGSHTFSNLTGSDKAEFRFTNGNGQVVFDFFLDYITSSNTVPSGYRSLGLSGGDGSLVTGTAAWLLSFNTSLSRNFNSNGFGVTNGIASNAFNLTLNSPKTVNNTSYNVVDPFFANWQFENSYEAVVSSMAFGAAGFGGLTIPAVHNSPPKQGSNLVTPTPCENEVTNTATVTAIAFAGTPNEQTLTATDSATVHINPDGPCPALEITKTASPDPVVAGQPVTYTYTVTNNGNTTLTNIVVNDDNGTPYITNDDFVVGTLASLASGDSATFTHTIIAPTPTTQCAVINGVETVVGFLIPEVLPSGDVKVTYIQSTGLNDNSYGANVVGWPGSHTFSNLTGSDKAEFVLYNGNNVKVMDFFVDYITATNTVPSGYKSLGISGGDGSLVTGSAAWLLSFDTSLSADFNTAGFGVVNGIASNSFNLTQNSPKTVSNTSYTVVDPFFANWEFRNIYTVTVSASAFGASGFGHAAVPSVHNSPPKVGSNEVKPTPCDQLINTGTVTAQDGATFLTSSSVAIVHVNQPVVPANIVASNVVISGKVLTLDLTNTGGSDASIQSLLLNWAAANKKLLKVKLDGFTLWDTKASPSSVSINTWKGALADRTIGAGQTLQLRFEFEDNASTNLGDYGLQIDFGGGLQTLI